jgi:predicted MPP superfamily phosphohydrolase
MEQRTLTRREFLKLTARWALASTVVGLGGLAYSHGIEPGWVDVQPVRLTLPRLAAPFHGYRVVQISDIHMSPWMTRARLADLVKQVNALEADLVTITGDFVSNLDDGIAHDLVSVLSTLQATNGVVGVLGNHDHWAKPAVIRQVMWDSGIVNVSNRVYTLGRGNALLHLAGVDDVWEQQDRLEIVLDQLPAEGAALLLAHEPDFADTSAATGRFDLQLSGHSHGGQIIMPGIGPLRLPYLGRKYPMGRYQVGSMIQYTNRGIGMVRPRVRFNCRPEITVFTLEAGQGMSSE